MIKITTKEEYALCLSRGVNPLFFNKWIKIDIRLRMDLQMELFGRSLLLKGDILRANDKFYHYCWDHSLMICENCGKSLFALRNIDQAYSATWVSHILSRGGFAEIAHDPRNHNILCGECHKKWESTKNNEMMIYYHNKEIIKELRQDYVNKL